MSIEFTVIATEPGPLTGLPERTADAIEVISGYRVESVDIYSDRECYEQNMVLPIEERSSLDDLLKSRSLIFGIRNSGYVATLNAHVLEDESGRDETWFVAAAARNTGSLVLCVALVTALAEILDAEITDDSYILGARSLAPTDVYQRFSIPAIVGLTREEIFNRIAGKMGFE